MNFQFPTLLSFALLFGTSPGFAADPATLDALVDKVIEIRKQRADLQKAEESALAEVRARLKAIEEKLNQIDVKPPQPVPPQPNPGDPLSLAIKAAFGEATPQKVEQCKLLAELYLQASVLAAKEDLATTAQLMGKISEASRGLGIDGLMPVRVLIANECKAALGTVEPPVPLTPTLRAKAKELFLRVHIALKGVA